MTFCVISSFDRLNDVTVTCQQWWRDVTKFEQNCHKFYVFNENFRGFKAGNYCMISRIPCSCLLIWNLSDLTRKGGMARHSLAIHTRFLVAPDKLHIKRHEHGILYLYVSTTDRWKTFREAMRGLYGYCAVSAVLHWNRTGALAASVRALHVHVRFAVWETYDPLAIFVPKKTRLKSCGCRTITAHPPHGYLAMPVQCFYRLQGLYRLGFFF